MSFWKTLFRSKESLEFELYRAISNGHIDKAKALLKTTRRLVSARFPGFGDERTPLHLAADNGLKDVAAVLLSNNAEVDARDRYGLTPLHLAAGRGHRDVVELLLANKADVNAKGIIANTPLHWAADTTPYDDAHEAQLKGTVELLLDFNADINAKNEEGETPFFVAIDAQRFGHGSRAVRELLYQRGAR